VTPVPTVFFGTGAFGADALRALVDDPEIRLVGVVAAPPRPAGRRQELTPSPIAAEALRLGVGPILTPERLRGDAVGEVLGLGPRSVILADYGRLVPPDLLAVELGAINLHPSLLPRHRGASPIPATILVGDPVTGVTIIRMDEGIDSGPIIASEVVTLRGDETSPWLEERLADVAADLLSRTVGPWHRGEIEAVGQDESQATMTRPLTRDDGRLDPSLPAAHLERAIRAYLPWPGSWVDTSRMGRLIIRSATIEPLEAGDEVGVLAAAGDGLALVVSDGRLRLGQVQLAGRRAMDAPTLRRGAPELVGSSVG
jgi:methionyl-tRNA formyltransferase